MKRKRIINLCLSSLATLGMIGTIASCGGSQPSSSIDESSSDDSGLGWEDDQKELLKQYCGEVLPYPSRYFSGKTTFNVVESEDVEGYTYLEIKDESREFSLQPYFQDLEEAGWNVVTTYSGETAQSNGTSKYVEVTKLSSDGKTGYDIFYLYQPSYYDAYGKFCSAGNLIRCFNDLSSSKSADVSWNEDAQDVMKEALTSSLPFIKMGDDYKAVQIAYDACEIYDTYALNLTNDYISILKNDGFALDEELSEKNDKYVLSKILSDGSIIDVALYYIGGNVIDAYYTPSEKAYTSWDNEFVSEINERFGISLPKFDVADGGKYQVYKKNDTYYIYTLALSDTYSYTNYIYGQLKNPSLGWDETYSIASGFIMDGEDPVGFKIGITASTPTSTFVSAWPSEVVANTVKTTLGIEGITLPALPSSAIPDNGEQIKYAVRGEEYYKEACLSYQEEIASNWEEYFADKPNENQIKARAEDLAKADMGMTISILDSDNMALEAYSDLLYKMGWYDTIDSDYNIVYEDPDGKISVTIAADVFEIGGLGTTSIIVKAGNGYEHQPEFAFWDEEVRIYAGSSKFLNLIKKMLPYEVTYTCDDSTGKITVDNNGLVEVAEGTAVGTTATITASIEIPGEGKREVTCKVVVKNGTNYTPESAINAVASVLREKGYEINIESEFGIYRFELNLGTSMSESEVKAMVIADLIPVGFTEFEEWQECSDDGAICQRAVYYIDNDDGTSAMLKYHVYTKDGNTIFYVSAW